MNVQSLASWTRSTRRCSSHRAATGINAVIYYAPTVLQSTGIPSASGTILATVGIGVVNVLMTVAVMLLADRAGRRPLLLGSLAGMTLALLLVGLEFRFSSPTSGLSLLSVASLMVYVGAMSVATATNWAPNLLVSSTFLTLIHVLGPSGTFWLYALTALGAWLFAFRLVPETRGRTLEEIERFWRPLDRQAA
jgi:predicted MFS family arabinose efflux permease